MPRRPRRSRTRRSRAARPGSGRWARSRRRPCGELAPFPLVVRLQQQALVPQQPQHGRLGDAVAVVAAHRPHLAVAPGQVRERVPAGGLPDALAGRARPRSSGMRAPAGAGLVTAPGPLGHADEPAEPRGRHALSVRITSRSSKGPAGPPDFFHTRSSTAASPSAWVKSATRASSCCSRVLGPDLPPWLARPDSRNWRFQVPIDCSDTFARRAASATVISPARIDSTIRTFSSGGSAGGLTMIDQTPSSSRTRKKRALPQSLRRDMDKSRGSAGQRVHSFGLPRSRR
ncbi:hypothetical protein ABIE67_007553 [Streptomyces sp. V4I8]